MACIQLDMTTKQLAASRERLRSFLAEMLPPLGRKDRQHWGGVYLRGLLLDGERKSVGAMAERLPDGNEQSLQPFVSQSPWAWEPFWQRMAERVTRAFPQPVAWIIDDTGFPQKGEHSVGVARQYSGTLGKPRGELPDRGQPAPYGRAGQFAPGLSPVLAERMDRGCDALPGRWCS
jgi:SRSO17 transposase